MYVLSKNYIQQHNFLDWWKCYLDRNFLGTSYALILKVIFKTLKKRKHIILY